MLYRLTQAALSVCVFLCLWTGAAHATGGEEPVTWTYIIGDVATQIHSVQPAVEECGDLGPCDDWSDEFVPGSTKCHVKLTRAGGIECGNECCIGTVCKKDGTSCCPALSPIHTVCEEESVDEQGCSVWVPKELGACERCDESNNRIETVDGIPCGKNCCSGDCNVATNECCPDGTTYNEQSKKCEKNVCQAGYELRTYNVANITGATLRGYGNDSLLFKLASDKRSIELRQHSSCWNGYYPSWWLPVLAIYPIPGEFVSMSLTMAATGDSSYPNDHPNFKDNEPFTITCDKGACDTRFQYYYDGCNGSTVHRVNFKNVSMTVSYCAPKESAKVESYSCTDAGYDNNTLFFGGCRKKDETRTCSGISDCCFKDIGSGLYNPEIDYTSQVKDKYYYDMYHCQYWNGGYSSDIYSCYLCFR